MTIDFVTQSLISKGFVLPEGESVSYVFNVPKLALSSTNPINIDIQYGYCTGTPSGSGSIVMANSTRIMRGSENNVWNDSGNIPNPLVLPVNIFSEALFNPTTNRVNAPGIDGYPCIFSNANGTLPPELEPNKIYYSTNFDEATYTAQLALSPGGIPIEFSTAGTGTPEIGVPRFVAVTATATAWGPVEFTLVATNGDVQIIDILARIPA